MESAARKGKRMAAIGHASNNYHPNINAEHFGVTVVLSLKVLQPGRPRSRKERTSD
jgi:hypothetical protein